MMLAKSVNFNIKEDMSRMRIQSDFDQPTEA